MAIESLKSEDPRCPICGVSEVARSTGTQIAGGLIYTCNHCSGFYLNPPVRVEYEASSWSAMRTRRWLTDVERGRIFASRISKWYSSEFGKPLRSVLEVGCGSAFMAPGMEENQAEYVGVDVDGVALSHAESNGIQVRKLPAEQLGESDLAHRHFDLVLSSNTYEHVDHPKLAFEALAKMKFSVCVIIVPNPVGILQRAKACIPIRRVIQTILKSDREIAYSIDGYWHNIAYSRKTMEWLAGLASVEIKSLRTIGINDSVFGFVQPNSSLLYRIASGCMTALDMESQLILVGTRGTHP